MPNFVFDVMMSGSVRLDAPDEQAARAMLKEALQPSDANLGSWPNGDPILAELVLTDDDEPYLVEVDGEAPEPPPAQVCIGGIGGAGVLGRLLYAPAGSEAAKLVTIQSHPAEPRTVKGTLHPSPVTAETWVNPTHTMPGHPYKHATGWGVMTPSGPTPCALVWLKVSEAEAFRPVWWDPQTENYNSKGVGIHMVGWEFFREADPEKGLRQVRVL